MKYWKQEEGNSISHFAIPRWEYHTPAMNQPLALLVYEKLLPGGQIANKLRDLGYRVVPVPDPGDLVGTAGREKPLVVVMDLEPHHEKGAAAIAALRALESTAHIPVLAFAAAQNEAAQAQARAAGATLTTNDSSILAHLDQFLDQALRVD